MPRVLTTEEIKPLLGNLARPNYFEMQFSLPINGELGNYLRSRGVDQRFVTQEVGLLCNSATLPGQSLATKESYNYIGLKENFAHTVQYDELTLEFFVDSSYRTLKFFEHWIEFIGSGNNIIDLQQPNYFREIKYPEDYKSDGCRLYKFENDNRNVSSSLNINRYQEYTFKGLFPKAVYPSAVGYDLDNQVMSLSVSFSYDRHQIGSVNSVDILNGTINNIITRVNSLNTGDILGFIN